VFTSQCLAVSYTITVLGSIVPATDSDGYGINSSGQVVGQSGDMGPPCLFAGGTIQSLGGEGIAFAINDNAQIVGQLQTHSGATPFLFSSGIMHELAFAGTTSVGGFAAAINKSGDVVGQANGVDDNGTLVNGAFLYSAGLMHNLDSNGIAYGINNTGQIAGSFANGFLYSNGMSQNPGTLPGAFGYTGRAINDHGEIAGTAQFSDGQHAFIYSAGVMHDLGLGAALGINEHGQAVGYRQFNGGVYDAFLYSGGSLYDLRDLVAGPPSLTFFREAAAINDAGQVTGTALMEGNAQAFLLTPIPEPSSIALAAFGFAGLMACGWRRRKRGREKCPICSTLGAC
jgi:probable HAF family extracellular repeat protein